MSTEAKAELDRIIANVAAAYSAAEEQGADLPSAQNTDNLASTVSNIKTVKFTEQSLTEDQKEQARKNIGVDGIETEYVEIVSFLAEQNILLAVEEDDGGILTDENENVLIM